MAGIVYPLDRFVKCLRRAEPRRTSQIELPLLHGVERGVDGLDELRRELDHGAELRRDGAEPGVCLQVGGC